MPISFRRQNDEPEPFEVLGAPPIISFRSLSAALTPAVGASMGRHPAARPAFIGMHLLATMEGTPVPEAPPSAPRPPSDQQHEVRALESVLQDALNNVTGRGDPNFFSRFAAHVRKPDSNPRPFALLELEFLCPSSLQSAEGCTFESHSGS